MPYRPTKEFIWQLHCDDSSKWSPEKISRRFGLSLSKVDGILDMFRVAPFVADFYAKSAREEPNTTDEGEGEAEDEDDSFEDEDGTVQGHGGALSLREMQHTGQCT